MESSILVSHEGSLLLIISVINLTGVITNAFYITRMNKIRVDRELMENLTDQNRAKDELLKDYKEEIEHLRKHKAACSVRHS